MLVRRALLVLTFLFSALSTTAQPITINGSPLTIVVGSDTAMQVHNSNVPGNGQFFPPTSDPGDAGVFVAVGSTVYGPGFLPGFNVTPLTPISIDSSGNGTPSNPYKVVVVADAGSALELTESLTYVNGDTTVGINLSFNAPPIGAPEGGLAFSAFMAGDIFLANNDKGFNFATPFTEAGSHAADLNCIEIPQYSIFFIGTTPADKYSANLYTQVWTEVSAGNLSDSSSNTCIDVGAALQWNRTYLGQTISIDTGVTFSGSICQPIDLQPSSLDPASVGTTYAETITASGGTAPYQFTHTGNLPPGLTLSTDGVVSGVPTLRGAFPFSVTAMDAAGCASPPTRYILLVSCPTITVTPEALPSGAVGFSYGPIQIDAVGAAPPNHFFVSSGQLPPGLSLMALPDSSASAQIVGTPTLRGSYSFSISARDSSGCTGTTSYSVPISTTCDPPTEPQNAMLAPHGNPGGPVTYVDYLDASWSPPSVGSEPLTYRWHINGRPDATGPAIDILPQAVAVPGSTDPIQLFVTAVASCGVEGPVASSPPYSPTAPTASFNAPVSGQTVTVTDVSAPEATSWLWLWGDGDYSTEQSPGSHTYPTADVYTIALIVTNGAGSHETSQAVDLTGTASADTAPRGLFAQDFDASNPRRQHLPDVHLRGRGEAWLHLWTNEAAREKVVFLRFLDAGGNAVVERRLAVGEEQTETVYNIEAFGLTGDYTIELVTDEGLAAALVEHEPLHRVDPPTGTRRINR